MTSVGVFARSDCFCLVIATQKPRTVRKRLAIIHRKGANWELPAEVKVFRIHLTTRRCGKQQGRGSRDSQSKFAHFVTPQWELGAIFGQIFAQIFPAAQRLHRSSQSNQKSSILAALILHSGGISKRGRMKYTGCSPTPGTVRSRAPIVYLVPLRFPQGAKFMARHRAELRGQTLYRDLEGERQSLRLPAWQTP